MKNFIKNKSMFFLATVLSITFIANLNAMYLQQSPEQQKEFTNFIQQYQQMYQQPQQQFSQQYQQPKIEEKFNPFTSIFSYLDYLHKYCTNNIIFIKNLYQQTKEQEPASLNECLEKLKKLYQELDRAKENGSEDIITLINQISTYIYSINNYINQLIQYEIQKECINLPKKYVPESQFEKKIEEKPQFIKEQKPEQFPEQFIEEKQLNQQQTSSFSLPSELFEEQNKPVKIEFISDAIQTYNRWLNLLGEQLKQLNLDQWNIGNGLNKNIDIIYSITGILLDMFNTYETLDDSIKNDPKMDQIFEKDTRIDNAITYIKSFNDNVQYFKNQGFQFSNSEKLDIALIRISNILSIYNDIMQELQEN